ncbi:hypothetical protein BH20VER2_BH20VER2_16840 [soil metagenome]|nr:hypothetical protein [Chthoniobacterales bacterium]
MNRVKLIVAAVVVLLVAGFGYTRCGRTNGPEYVTAVVTRGPITQAVTATGTLNRASQLDPIQALRFE